MFADIEFSDAEKIATIMSSRKSGVFGLFVPVSQGWTRIELTDAGKCYMCVLVKADRIGWTVSFCGIEFTDAALEVAAKFAVDWKKERAGQAIVTKNVRVPLGPAKKRRRQSKNA